MTRTDAREEALANLRLAVPIVAGQLGTMAMGLVDTAIVGRVGEEALAGVALGNNLVVSLTLPAAGLLFALEPIVAQALGAGDRSRARAALRVGLKAAVLLAVPLTILCFASLRLLELFEVDPRVIPDARAYLVARLPSVLPFFVFMAGKTYQQAAARPRYAVEAVVIANVVHAVAGWIAVLGDAGLVRLGLPAVGLPAYGAAGAGIATSLSSVVLAAWVVIVRSRVPRGAPDALDVGERDDGALDRPLGTTLVRVGAPIGFQLFAEVGIFSLVGLLMGRLGGRATAAHQIALGLASFSFMGALGIAQATSVRVGLAIGEGRPPRRAGAIGLALGIVVMGLWAIVFASAPRALARVFTPEAPVLDAAEDLLRIAAIFQLADGAQVVSAGALRGAADTRFPMIANVVAHWGFGLPLAWWLGFHLHWGARGLWFGLTAGLVVIALALTVRFFVLTRGAIASLDRAGM